MQRKNKIRVIVNADDLGISLEVNSQIEECIKQGVVSSTTLLVNAPAFEDGVRIAKQYTNVSVGIHLNLVEFAPLTNTDVFRDFGIVGSDGNFIEGAIFIADCNNERLKRAVFEEWDAQLCKFKSFGINPTHIDSHQHTHTIIGLQEALCEVMKKHNITKVRRKMVPSIRLMLKGRQQTTAVKLDKSKAVVSKKRNVFYRRFHVFVAKYYGNKWNRQMAKHFVMTDSFYAFRHFYSNLNDLRIRNTIELMCHPGHTAYENESNELINNQSWLSGEYKLISYGEL